MKKQKVKIGDILEIPTAKGLAYAQYTHEHRIMGGLLRVFDSLLNQRPGEFASIVNGPVRFSTFFPVRAAVNMGIFRVIAHHEIAGPNKSFPIFRYGLPDPTTKKVAVWCLWDGEKQWGIGEINEEQRKLPLKEVWNDKMLVQRIEEGWRPEDDE